MLAKPDGQSVVCAHINMPIKLGESRVVVKLAKVITFCFFATLCLSPTSAVIDKDAVSEAGRSTCNTLPIAAADFHTVVKAQKQNHHV